MEKHRRFYIHLCGSQCDVLFQGLSMHTYIPMKDTSFTAVNLKSEKNIEQIVCLLNTGMIYTSIYQYILVCTITTHVFIQIRLEPPCYAVSSPLPSRAVHLLQRSASPYYGHSLFDGHTTQARLSATKLPVICHCRGFASYTLLPRLPSTAAESAQPNGKPESLRLLNLWEMVRVEFPARKQGIRGTLPTIFWVGATYRQSVGDGSYSPASSMGPLMGTSSWYALVHTISYWHVLVHTISYYLILVCTSRANHLFHTFPFPSPLCTYYPYRHVASFPQPFPCLSISRYRLICRPEKLRRL